MRPQTAKLQHVGGGEIPPRAEVGSRFIQNTSTILETQAAQGSYSLRGVYLPRALCRPVLGLWMSVWGLQIHPILVCGTSPAAVWGVARYDHEL